MLGATTVAGAVALLALFSALCAIFIAAVTAIEWYQGWPGSHRESDLELLAGAFIACLVLFALARLLGARERAHPATPPLPNQPSLGWGIFCALIGVSIIAAGGYRALAGNAGPDGFLVVPAGSIFLFAGILIATPLDRVRLRGVCLALMLTAFAICFDWTAFGPGERHFTGGISAGAVAMGGRVGEWPGRIAFGIGGVLSTVAAIAAWVRALR